MILSISVIIEIFDDIEKQCVTFSTCVKKLSIRENENI